ncbi:flagellin [Bdellovibrio bacteriovorus]|uniref:Flagellin n=1 Tax=Bdellovibrio bacteriovorus (strain ATCC 15356 / DSM 50701 / NCIMB 9529 / HD100) TaxID=264462 RepID=Q6MQQ0_BDEBA|nr:flagellin [Bdellovibrio bacteriovorus]AHZ86031.1 flagellin [Bdellovibrio bacteriovorus]BEV66956.1 Flagellin [Bdellovibrio bacteriovorus]CAE78397.1 flagellin [Bdellovibrio bacteriovorus HD100]
MGLRIGTNVAALNAQKNLYMTNINANRSMARLASGMRINQAADDAAGLAISENLKGQIRGLRQANRNANDGISLVQVAEGSLNEVSNMLIRLRELGVQASSDTIGETERKFLDVEYQQLKSEIQRITESTVFNGYELLNGTGGMIDIQVGVNNDAFRDRISFNAGAANASIDALGLTAENVGTKESAQLSLGTIDQALTSVNAIRANFGALQNRLQSTSNNLLIADENLSAANSRIRDTDVAAETSEMTRNNILLQAGVSVLGQANQSQQLALKLLG